MGTSDTLNKNKWMWKHIGFKIEKSVWKRELFSDDVNGVT